LKVVGLLDGRSGRPPSERGSLAPLSKIGRAGSTAAESDADGQAAARGPHAVGHGDGAGESPGAAAPRWLSVPSACDGLAAILMGSVPCTSLQETLEAERQQEVPPKWDATQKVMALFGIIGASTADALDYSER
jgi:hypothetical protein